MAVSFHQLTWLFISVASERTVVRLFGRWLISVAGTIARENGTSSLRSLLSTLFCSVPSAEAVCVLLTARCRVHESGYIKCDLEHYSDSSRAATLAEFRLFGCDEKGREIRSINGSCCHERCYQVVREQLRGPIATQRSSIFMATCN